MRAMKTNGPRFEETRAPQSYMESIAQAPSQASELLRALETRSPFSPQQMRDRMAMLENELAMVREGRIDNPQMLFRRAAGDKYAGLTDISPKIQAEAEQFYNDAINRLKSEAYTQTAGNRNPMNTIGMYQPGDIVRSIRNAGLL